MIDLDAIKAKLAEYDEARPRCPLRITRHHTIPDPYGDYDMTTYSPCCRPEGHEGECSNSRLILGWPGLVTVSALVAEVEHLRTELAARNGDNYTELAACMGCEPHEVPRIIQQHAPFNGRDVCEHRRTGEEG